MKIYLPRYRIGQKAYLYLSNGCVLVEILESYRINGIWHYDIDCSNYATGMELAGVNERMLGIKSNPSKGNIYIPSITMDKIYHEMIN